VHELLLVLHHVAVDGVLHAAQLNRDLAHHHLSAGKEAGIVRRLLRRSFCSRLPCGGRHASASN
jgi:hypothetical protein